ncbi:protein Brevis radix-like 4 [Camellia sinensis]|nr:protein Brevis radix-like 4 [Camellia sinensis]
MNALVEDFLSRNRVPGSDSHSSLQEDLVYDHQNRPDRTSLIESTNRQDRRMEDHLDVVGVRELPQNGEDTPRNSNRLSDAREPVPIQSNESGSRSPKAPPKTEGQKEVIEQFEPGVYVTLIQLQEGTKIFKRVRFSKRRFAEQQAEEWWKENKDRLLKKYSPPPTSNNTPTRPPTTPTPADENAEVVNTEAANTEVTPSL